MITARCLNSIASSQCITPYEVIVVDDDSPDKTAEFLFRCPGLKVVTNETNHGYLRSTNIGAKVSSSDFLILLNNDTEVTDGWIDHLLSTFKRFPDTGITGACLVYPDGKLQEAGGIIFTDGTGINYGRLQSVENDAYRFVREVDYCSAACIAVRRKLWEQIGGFDERFSPAYYEDTDLAFEARKTGWKVRFQPAAQIIHHEGISHGTDPSSGIKAQQIVNREILSKKWEV